MHDSTKYCFASCCLPQNISTSKFPALHALYFCENPGLICVVGYGYKASQTRVWDFEGFWFTIT